MNIKELRLGQEVFTIFKNTDNFYEIYKSTIESLNLSPYAVFVSYYNLKEHHREVELEDIFLNEEEACYELTKRCELEIIKLNRCIDKINDDINQYKKNIVALEMKNRRKICK